MNPYPVLNKVGAGPSDEQSWHLNKTRQSSLFSTFPDVVFMENGELRQRAEELVALKGGPPSDKGGALAPGAARQVFHELQVHQIELEMQNEELHQGQIALENARARYFDLYDLAPVGYCTLSENGMILEANLTAASMLGVERSSLVHQFISKFILKENQDAYYLQRKQLLESGELREWDLRMVKANHSVFWVQLTANVTEDSFGSPVCRVILKDINDRKLVEAALQKIHEELEQRVTERTQTLQKLYEELQVEIAERKLVEESLRQSEERLQLILRGSKDAPWDWNLETNQVFYSPRWWDMLGYEVDELPQDSGLWERLVHPQDHPQVEHVFHGALASGASAYELEVRLRHKDGHFVPVLSRGLILRDPSGKPKRVSGTYTDLTERKQAEAAKADLEAKKSQLRKAESIDVLVGAISHHFNNKLQAALASLEVMEELPQGTDLTKYLKVARQATERAVEVSRLMQVFLGHLPGNRGEVFLAELCHSSLSILQPTLPQSVTLEMDCPLPGPKISANAIQLEQALANLITNATEAMGEASGSIRVSLKSCKDVDIPSAHRFPIGWQPKESDFVCLEVADTGAGILEADIDKVFDPFFSTKLVGRGVGLSLVLGVVRAHGGTITVASQPGRGSTFRLFFPLLPDDSASLPEASGRTQEQLTFGTSHTNPSR